MIIAMRLGGMAGFWNVTKAENNLMSTEKLAAVQASAFAAAAAMMFGANPAGVALAALKPVRRKTKANVRRLGKRGLKFRPSSVRGEIMIAAASASVLAYPHALVLEVSANLRLRHCGVVGNPRAMHMLHCSNGRPAHLSDDV
jgi:hypothetical protein